MLVTRNKLFKTTFFIKILIYGINHPNGLGLITLACHVSKDDAEILILTAQMLLGRLSNLVMKN